MRIIGWDHTIQITTTSLCPPTLSGIRQGCALYWTRPRASCEDWATAKQERSTLLSSLRKSGIGEHTGTVEVVPEGLPSRSIVYLLGPVLVQQTLKNKTKARAYTRLLRRVLGRILSSKVELSVSVVGSLYMCCIELRATSSYLIILHIFFECITIVGWIWAVGQVSKSSI